MVGRASRHSWVRTSSRWLVNRTEGALLQLKLAALASVCTAGDANIKFPAHLVGVGPVPLLHFASCFKPFPGPHCQLHGDHGSTVEGVSL
jgi:hypothetical protein